MLTRCPACETTFKVTPEQLKLRGGKVRCGKCQSIFNALDSLVETPATIPEATTATPASQATSATETTVTRGQTEAIAPEPAANMQAIRQSDDASPGEDSPPSPEAIRDAAITHGLVAARETTEIPGYNKWAEGAFTTPATVSAPAARSVWPFFMTSILLLTLLAGQILHYFRAELAVSVPGARPLLESACAALDCDIPLPRHVELVSIEASDLQVDPGQGGTLILTATLKNRASYAQAWPLLEITLTDVQDSPLLRRVLQPVDYLPSKADPTVFPPNGEIGLKLWLEAKDVVAAGYRLYVFYP